MLFHFTPRSLTFIRVIIILMAILMTQKDLLQPSVYVRYKIPDHGFDRSKSIPMVESDIGNSKREKIRLNVLNSTPTSGRYFRARETVSFY